MATPKKRSRTRSARANRRRKKRMDAVEHDLTPEHWQAIQDAWDTACAYCGEAGKPLQRDCVLAISRGGRYTVANVVPACGKCNTSKCNEEVTVWLRRTRRNESGFLLRYFQVRKSLSERFSSASSSDSTRPPQEAAV